MGSTPPLSPRLVIIEGKDKGKVISLKQGTVVIGRSKGDVLIHDPRISRSHVAFHFEQRTGKLTYTDLKSLNGTMINGDQKEAGELQDGDKLQIGDTTLDCQIGPVEETLASYHRMEPKKSESKKPAKPKKEPESKDLELAPEIPESERKTKLKNSPSDTDDDPPSDEVAPHGLKSIYLALPRPVRIGGLLLLLLILFGLFLPIGKPSIEALEREIASVKELESQGKVNEAVSKAEKLKKEFPENSQAYMLLGDIYLSQRKNELAIATYRQAHDLNPPQPQLHIKLVRLYLLSGFTKEGLEELKHVDNYLKEAQESPESKEIFIETAKLFLDFKDELKPDPTKTLIIARALQNSLAPDRAIGYRLEADNYLSEGKYQEMQEILERGRKIEPKDEGTLNSLIKAKLYLKDIAGAQQVAESWMQIAPTATKPLLVMAFLKFHEKNYMAALPYLQKITQILAKTPTEPDYAQALHNMGLIYYEQNQLAEAERSFRQACDLGIAESCAHPLLNTPNNPDKNPASLGQPAAAPQ